MGSGSSRGKKVAPACVGEAGASPAAASTRDARSSKRLRTHAAQRGAQRDSHSDGHDTEEEEEEEEEVLDTALAHCDTRGRAPLKAKKTAARSRTYGLCRFRRGRAEEDPRSCSRVGESGTGTPARPRGSESAGSADVNKRSDGAATHTRKHAASGSAPHTVLVTGGPLQEVAPASEEQSFDHCPGSSLTTPVILYDGSEEELMDTIEREFS